MVNDSVAEYLEIPPDLVDDFFSLDLEYHADMGSSGDMTYGYYFEVPEDTSEALLCAMRWDVGDTVELPLNIFDVDEPDEL